MVRDRTSQTTRHASRTCTAIEFQYYTWSVNPIPFIFSCLVVTAGWFYLWHAPRAGRLAILEGSRNNLLRIRLRRIGGLCMVALGVVFYLAWVAVNRKSSPIVVLVALASIVVLMMIVLFLGWVDIRLTRKMRDDYFKRNATQ